MSLQGRTIAVTGANGFLGSALCKFLTEQGASVRALVRDTSRHPNLRVYAGAGVYRFDLAGEIDDESLAPPLDTIIHGAYVIEDRNRERSNRINLEGARRLLHRSGQNGIKQFVFISSLAAHQNARSGYGRSKWLLENEIATGFATIIKPGTIIGNGGVFQRLREIIKKLRCCRYSMRDIASKRSTSTICARRSARAPFAEPTAGSFYANQMEYQCESLSRSRDAGGQGDTLAVIAGELGFDADKGYEKALASILHQH